MAGRAPPTPPPFAGDGDIEAGFSGGSPFGNPLCYRRRSYRAIAPPPPARLFLDDLSDDECHHFLDSCFLCKKRLTGNRDIYMYRGDLPFCSEDCRQEQIERDEARERNLNLSYRKEQQHKLKKSSSPTRSQRIGICVGTIVPA